MLSHTFPEYKTNDINLAFRTAAANGKKSDLAFMKKHVQNVDINQGGKTSGMTALHQAARKGNVEAAQFLIEHGANINALDTQQKTPLHNAIEENQLKLTQLLLAQGADPNIEDNNKKNAYACAENKNDILQALNLMKLAHDAWQTANQLFPKVPNISSASISDKIENNVIRDINQIGEQFSKLTSIPVPKDKIKDHTNTLLNLRDYFLGLLSIYHILNMRVSKDMQFSFCDCIASSMFYSLMNNHFSVERFHVFDDKTKTDHAFIVLNRPPDSDPLNPDTWGQHAYFINSNGEMYATAIRPKDCLLNLLNHLRVKIISNQIPNLDKLAIPQARNLAEETHTNIQSRLHALSNSLPSHMQITYPSPSFSKQNRND